MDKRKRRLLCMLEGGKKYKWIRGAPPLSFKAHAAGELDNYRIYGNTIGGESVGDRTGNLFDMKKFAELCFPRYASVTFADNTLSFTSTAVDAYVNYVCGKGDTVINEYRPSCIDVLPSTTYTISMSSVPKCFISWINSSFKAVSAYTRIPNNQSSYTFTTPEDCTKLLFRFGKEVTNIGDTFTISNVMLNEGSTALPYEPYGYKASVTVSNSTDTLTTPIYLPEQIRKVGEEAEYIDYGEQKMHRVRKNLWSGVVEQGSVSTIGNYTDALNRIRSKNISLSPGIYTISCDLGIRCIFAYNNSEKVSCVVDNGGSAKYSNTFTVPIGANNVSVGLRAFDASGAAMDNVKPSDFKWGQIEKGSEVTTYEPYIENTDLDVTLPALPTLTGTTVLSVGTAVQPSRVEVKGRIKAVGQETEPEPETAEAEQE